MVPRVIETFRMTKAKIVENVPRDLVLGEVVVTGGGAHLIGIDAIAEEVFGLPVRMGTPQSVAGLTEALKQPEYATAIGLVLFGPNGGLDNHHYVRRKPSAFTKFRSWLGDLWN